MLKPSEIRKIITRANPYLKDDPDKLQVFLDSGTIVSTGALSLSYLYEYTLNIIVQDYRHHPDQIFIPLLVYLRTQQPELFENYDKNKNVIRFDAEILNQQCIDLSIEVDLTERVIIKDVEGKLVAEHAAEPQHPDFPENDVTIELYNKNNDTLIGTFVAPAWKPKFNVG